QHLHQPVPDVGRPRPHPLQLRRRQRRGLPPGCHPQPRPRVGANGQTRRRRGLRPVPRSHQRHARLLSRAHQRAAAAALAARLDRLHPGAPEHRQDGEPGLGSQHHHGEPPGHRGRVLDGDSAITAADRILLGNTYRELLASIYSRLTWRRFDLSFLLQGRLGYTMNDAFGSGATRLFERFNNLTVAYWTPMKCEGGPNPSVLDGPPGMTAAQQAAIQGCNSYWNPSAGRENPLYNDVNSSSPAYRPGGHWRVRNITVGYTLPASLVSRFRFSSLRVYAP